MRTPRIPALVLSEYVTYNAAQPLSKAFAAAPDIWIGAKNAFGVRTAPRDRYERARDALEWKNAAAYYDYLMKSIDPKDINPSPFVMDDLLDLPEYIEGKHMYQSL